MTYRLFGLYDIRIAHALIAENISVAVEHFIHAADLLSRLHTLGNFAALVLRERRHNGKAKFSVSVHRPDVVLHEIHLDVDIFELSRRHKGIDGISRKPAHFTGYD